MANLELLVDSRTVTGKKVKALRRQGIVPAHLYGRDTESLAIQVPTRTMANLLRTAGRNAIIELQINGERDRRPVVLRGVQRNPVTGELVHIDFFQISLTETLRSQVPLVLVGEAPAASVYGGVLLQGLDHVIVEALPADIPAHIEVNVSQLETIDSSLFVRDLAIPPKVNVLSDPDQVVAKVAAPRLVVEAEAAAAEERPEEAAKAAEAAAAEAEAAGEAAEEGD